MGTLIVGMVVFGLIGLAVRKIYQDRKNGKGCGGGCDGCTKCPGNSERKS